ncbi:MAG: hypothetical protein LBI05_08315 [Planctomycetaceae bacterium]|jgi:hypothetical protein|nr:hypothetical protein [Planctomycetaceae bacterium]
MTFIKLKNTETNRTLYVRADRIAFISEGESGKHMCVRVGDGIHGYNVAEKAEDILRQILAAETPSDYEVSTIAPNFMAAGAGISSPAEKPPMSNRPRRIEVEEALSKVSEAARAAYPYPFSRREIFHNGRVERLDGVLSPAVRELAEAGLLTISVKLDPVAYDDEYRSWKETWERIKDLPHYADYVEINPKG